MGFSFKKLWEKATPQDEEAQRRANANLQRATRQLANTPAKYGVMRNPAVQQQFVRQQSQPVKFNTAQAARQVFPTAAKDVGTGLGLRGMRTAIGLGQSASGLYDLATPGLGTNRFSKTLHSTAKDVDRTAKSLGGGAKMAYDTSAPVMEAAAFVAGGGIIKAAGALPKVAKVVAKGGQYTKPVTTAVNRMNAGAGKTAAKALTNPANLANMGVDAAYTLGQEASRGRDISKTDVALSVGASAGLGVGLPVIANKLSRGVRVNTGGAKSTAKKADELVSHEGAPDRARVDFYKKQIEEGKKIQPIKIINEGNKYGIEDGKHRYQAMREMGVKNIPTREVNTKGNFIKPTATLKNPRLQPLNQVGGGKLDGPKPVAGRPSQAVQGQQSQPTQVSQQNLSDSSTGSIPPTDTPPVNPAAGRNIADEQIQAAKDTKNSRNQKKLTKIVNAVRREVIDPYNIFVRYDRKYAKAMMQDLERMQGKNRTLPELIQSARYITNEQKQMVYTKRSNGKSVADVIQKYGEGTPQGEAFVNFLNNRFALEVYKKTGKNILKGKNMDDVARTVDDYAARNKEAVDDALTIKEHSDALLDYAAEHGVITKELADFVKSNYSNYAPLNRVLPDDLIQGQFSGGVGASVGIQKVVQSLEGSWAEPDVTFGTIIQRTGQAIKQGRMNDLDNELLTRTREGQFGKLLIDPETTIKYKAKKEEFKQLVKDIDSLRKEKRNTVANKRVAAVILKGKQFAAVKAARAELRKALDGERTALKNKVNTTDKKLIRAKGKAQVVMANSDVRAKQAAERVKKLLLAETKDPDARAAISGMSSKDLLETTAGREFTFKINEKVAMSQAQVSKLAKNKQDLMDMMPDAQSRQGIANLNDDELMDVFRAISDEADGGYYTGLKKALGRAEQQYSGLTKKVDDLRSNINKTDEQRDEAFQEMVTLQQDPTTGKQIIQGQYKGEKFAIEIPPDFADGLAALNAVDQRNVINTIAQFPADVQKALYTGVFAPVFTAINTVVKNQMMMFGNARGLSPYGARAFGNGFAAAINKGMRKELEASGFIPEVATQSVNSAQLNAKLISSRAGLGSFLRYTAKDPGMAFKDLYHGLNQFGAVIGNMQRVQIGSGAYYNAINRNIPHDEAMRIAARAANEVLGNFNRVSQAARLAEPILLYAGAAQSGIRATGGAFRARPIETTVKYTALAVGMGATAAAVLANEKGQEFYKDMLDSGKGYILDGSLVFLSPTADKVTKEEAAASNGKLKEGEWQGVWKIPIPPDLRSLNRAIQRELYSASNGRGVNPSNFAKEAFNYISGGYMTDDGPAPGDYREDVENRGRGINLGNILDNNPTYKITQTIKNNIDPYTEKAFEDPETKNTTDAARNLAKVYNTNPFVGDITPAQAEAALGQGGMVGKIIANKEGTGALGTVKKTVEQNFRGARGRTEYGKQMDDEAKIIQDVKPNKDEIGAYNSIHPHRKDRMGESLNPKTYYDGQDMGATYRRYPKTFEIDRRKNEIRKAEGKMGDPLFDLPEDKRQIVLKNMSEGPGSKEVAASYIRHPWLKEFGDQRGAFFDQIFAENKTAKSTKDPGGLPIVEKTPHIESLQEQLNKITDGAQRGEFYSVHPELTQYYRDSDKNQAAKRKAMGYEPYDPYPEAPAHIQKLMDTYNSLPKGDGKKGGSPTRSRYLKEHPEIIKEWDRKSRYDLANAGALAVYEGIDFDAEDIKDMRSIARNSDAQGNFSPNANGQQYSSFSGGYEDKKTSSQNPLKYAISLNAGGKTKTPTVKKTKIAKTYVAGKTRPKVTMKKRKARI